MASFLFQNLDGLLNFILVQYLKVVWKSKFYIPVVVPTHRSAVEGSRQLLYKSVMSRFLIIFLGCRLSALGRSPVYLVAVYRLPYIIKLVDIFRHAYYKVDCSVSVKVRIEDRPEW